MQILPGETILHVSARRDGLYPRDWRFLAALNGLLDPFQGADNNDRYQPTKSQRLAVYQEIRERYDG